MKKAVAKRGRQRSHERVQVRTPGSAYEAPCGRPMSEAWDAGPINPVGSNQGDHLAGAPVSSDISSRLPGWEGH